MAKANVPAKQESVHLTQQEAIESLNANEQKVYEALRKRIDKKIEDDLWDMWELGKDIAKYHAEIVAKNDMYGNKFFERLSLALLGAEGTNILRAAMLVFTRWPTKVAFTDKITKITGPQGNRLTKTHVQYLSSIQNEQIRDQLALTTVAENWSTRQLFDKIKELLKERARGYGGRTPRAPASVANCLSHMKVQAAKFVNLFDNAWTGDAFDMAKEISKLPEDMVTDTLLTAVIDTEERLEELEGRVRQARQLVSKTEDEIRARLDGDTKEEEEEEEEDPKKFENMSDWKKRTTPAKAGKKAKK